MRDMTPPETGKRRAPAMSPEQRRDMIVRAAIPLVIAHGSSVTTRQIAQAAGIGEGTIFRVFADKDELLQACVAEALSPGNSLAELASIDLGLPLAERLAEAADVLRAHLDRIGAVIGALHTTGGRTRTERPAGGPLPERDDRGMTATRDAVAELFAPERESLRLPPEQLAQLFLGLLLTHPDDEPDTAALVYVFLHGALTHDHDPDD
ncbi:TetR/AcrR family transcriptional regulator [Streptomyces sp. NPDC059909]|uniref:TetR/AcrR family transcriptional regulator n=1 Tax=Streptomyces sp. NPDC059909 TaxID=3346998 RepID=UPI00365003D8